MSKVAFKVIVLFSFLLAWAVGLPLHAESAPHVKPTPTSDLELVSSAIEQAEGLLVRGQRREAIQQLDTTKNSLKSRRALRKILEKRKLLLEQFLKSEAFQNYQEAKSFFNASRWNDCLREVNSIEAGDQSNIHVLQLKVMCHRHAGEMDAAMKTTQKILEVLPEDVQALLESVEIDILQKKFEQGLKTLQSLAPKESEDIERHAILKARILHQLNRTNEALEVLRQDQEAHLDHVQVLYELGMLYVTLPGNDWLARKFLSLFVTRCRRVNAGSIRSKQLESLLPKAQSTLAEVDQRLQI